MIWAGRVARTGEKRCTQGFGEETGKNVGGDGRIVLNFISKKWDKGYGLD
jgi:hypothetical protein